MVQEYNSGENLREARYPDATRGSVIHDVIDELHKTQSWNKVTWLYMRGWQREEQRTDEPPIRWTGIDRREFIREGYTMLKGYAADPRNRNADVVAGELSFVTPVAGKYFAIGQVDQIRRISGGYQLIDFKTGYIPAQLELDNSYQLALYAIAMLDGRFFPKDQPGQSISFKEFPVSLGLMRLTDYTPYANPTPKTISYVSEAAYFGVPLGTVIKPRTERNKDGHPLLTKGANRGPVLYESRFDLDNLPQFEKSIANAVSMVRLNRYAWANSTMACSRCSYRYGACRGIVRESGHELADLNFSSSRRRIGYGTSISR